MASAPSRTLFHFTSKKINAFQRAPKDQVRLLGLHGKPMGFWYAYGTDWRNWVKAGQAGRSANTVALRYKLTLPQEAFVSEVDSATPDTLLELSASNLDEFMKRFHREAYRTPLRDLLSAAFHVWIKEEKSDLLDELADRDDTGAFRAFLDELQEEKETEEEDPDEGMFLELVYDGFYEVVEHYHPSSAALRGDAISDYDWEAFWKDVASSMGGVEFHTDVFPIQEWKGLWLPWTATLDVKSGVIFHPSTFREGVVAEQILKVDPMPARGGGRRRTRRGLRPRPRNKTRNRGW